MLRLRFWQECSLLSRVLIAFTAVLLLLISVYQLDRIRLRHNLNTYREELKKQGVKFTLKEIWPEPPTEAAIAGYQLFKDCQSLKTVDLISFHRVEPNRPRQAFSPYTHHQYVRLCLLPDTAYDWQQLRDVISSNKVSLEKIRTALKNTNLAFSPPQTTYSNLSFTIYQEWRLLCNAIEQFKGSVFLHLHQKEFTQAQSEALNLLLLYKLSSKLPTSPYIQHSLTPTACGIWELLQFDVWTDAQLSEIQTILESIDYYTPTKLYFKLNKVQTAPLIQDGKANFPFPDSITPQSNSEQIISIIKRPFDFDHFEKFLDRYPRYWDWCWRKSFKTELLCLQNSQFWIHVVEESQTNPPLAKLYQESSERFYSMENKLYRKDSIFAYFVTTPASVNYIEHIFVSEIIRKLTITAVALKRYHQKNGNYPESLSELVPTYLPNTPTDPMDQKPFRYHKNSDDTYSLYSISLNGTDDKGSLSFLSMSPFKYNCASLHDDIPWPQAATPEETQTETIMMEKRQIQWEKLQKESAQQLLEIQKKLLQQTN